MVQKSRLYLRRRIMSKDEIITELVELILMQEKEINKLNKKLKQVKQYIDVYEEYIKGE
jgi:peptidoglycan hydrolase CwlO-like protein